MNNTDVSIRSAARYLFLWLVVIALFMTALPVVAQGPDGQNGEQPDQTAKRATQIQGGGQPVPAEVGPQAIIIEGFEDGGMPPFGWTQIQANPNETWEIATSDPHSGSYYAEVLYDDALLDQDEVLLSPTFSADSGNVSLWSFGSPYWCRDTYDNCDLEVWFVNGDWDGGGSDDVYLGSADGDWTDTFIWSDSTFDFSPYASGSPARIGVDDITTNYSSSDPPPLPELEISPVMKNYDDGQQICTSIYTITNESTYVGFYSHEFYDSEQGGSVIHTLPDTISGLGTAAYDLADIAPIPDGYRGRVVISSDNPFTVTLVSCPPANVEWNIYLPIVLQNYPPPSEFYPVADTTVLQGAPTTNFGSTVDMWVGYDHCYGGQISRSLVRFDLSSIPAGMSISQARLYLYLMGSCDIGERTHTATVYRTNASWSSSSVTWNTQPGYAEAYGSASIPSRTWGWYSFSVTNLVRGWVDGSFPNYGLMLRGPESSGEDSACLNFYTLDKTGFTYDPYLSITYAGMATSEEVVPAVEKPTECGTTVKDMLDVFSYMPAVEGSPKPTECGTTVKDMLDVFSYMPGHEAFEAVERTTCSPD